MATYMQIVGTLIVMFSRFGGFLITDTLASLHSSPNRVLICGFWLLRFFIENSNMLILIIFISLLIRFLGEFRGKSVDLKNGFYSGFDFSGICCLKMLSWKICLYKFVQSSSTLEGKKELKEEEEENQEVGKEGNEGLEVLKEAIEIEKERANAASWELEQERMSASSAAEEAMSMILRLQREKNEIEMEANQYKRLVEQKQQYDDEVIGSLRWIVMRHESERSILLNHLKLCKEKLEHYDESDPQLEELNEILNCTFEDQVTGGGVVSSLDMDSSLMMLQEHIEQQVAIQ